MRPLCVRYTVRVTVLTVDPGESCGYSVWRGPSALESAGTAELWAFIDAVADAAGVGIPSGLNETRAMSSDAELVHRLDGFDLVVCEDWALYPWELQNLAWDKCRTARGIGALELICRAAGIPFRLQPAAIKDQAVAAGAEDFYLRPLHENRHANDAIQHGVVHFLTTARTIEGGKVGV